MIERIKAKYKPDGEWLITSRERTRYRDKSGKEVDFYYALHHRDECTSEDYTEDISEGPCDDYWEATAANANFIIGMNAAVRIIRKISAKVLVMITGKQQPRMPFGRCISL